MCFDGDEAGRRAAYRGCERVLPLLKAGFSLQFVQLPKGEDPDSLIQAGSSDMLRKILSRPRTLHDLLWDKEVTAHRTDTPEQQALVRKNIFMQLKEIPDNTIRELYRQEFNQRFFKSFRQKQKTSGAKTYNQPQENRSGTRTHFDSKKRQFYILFALIINHPEVVHEVGEQFAELELGNEALENLREEIFLAFNELPDLDVQGLRSHILKQGFKDLVEAIVCADTYLHAPFAKPETPLTDVMQGWRDISQLVYAQTLLKDDIFRTRGELTDTMTPQVWQKFRQLKQQTLHEE